MSTFTRWVRNALGGDEIPSPPTQQPVTPPGVQVTTTQPPFNPPWRGQYPSVPPAQPWAGYPTQAWGEPSWANGAFSKLAGMVDTVFACLDLNTDLLSTFPVALRRNGVVVADNVPLWMYSPHSRYNGWKEFARQVFFDFLMGEAFILATAHYATGYPGQMLVLDPWRVEVTFDANGSRRYRLDGRPIPEQDLLHLRYFTSPHSPRGIGPLDFANNRLLAAAALQQYATGFALQGGVPWAVITHPTRLMADQIDELKAQWWEARTNNLGLPAVMSGGVGIETLATINPREAAAVELSAFMESRIATLLRTPPFLMNLPSGGDSMTYSNVEFLRDHHDRAALLPWSDAFGQALSNWALPAGTSLTLDPRQYTQPGLQNRALAYGQYIDHGVLSAAEVRVMEGWDFGGGPALPLKEVDQTTPDAPPSASSTPSSGSTNTAAVSQTTSNEGLA